MKDRLNKLMDYLGYNAATFSSEIGVQRSSISHILSGRNQPSFDFLVKVVNKYPEINSEWLLTGKGDIIRHNKNSEAEAVQQNLFNNINELKDTNVLKDKAVRNSQIQNENSKITFVNYIERVILFYNDGTFFEYLPNSRKNK